MAASPLPEASTALNGGASSTSANSFCPVFCLACRTSLGKSYQYENPMTANEWQYGLYAQDSMAAVEQTVAHLRSSLENYPIFSRTGGGMQRYDFNTNKVILGGVDGQPNGGGTTSSKLQFAPRAGLSYRLNDKTVLRAGYGISINPYPFTRAMRDPYPVTIAQQVTALNSYSPAWARLWQAFGLLNGCASHQLRRNGYSAANRLHKNAPCRHLSSRLC